MDTGAPIVESIVEQQRHPPRAENPCVRRVGPGPLGAVCGACANLTARHLPTRWARDRGVVETRTIYACELTGQVKRVLWPACANYVAAA